MLPPGTKACTPAFELRLDEALCAFCGQCASFCPTAAIVEKDDTAAVWKALSDPSKHVIVQTAPAIRVVLGEALVMQYGSIVNGKMVAALRRIGFDRVFDTDFTAELTIMEEGNEFIHRHSQRQAGTSWKPRSKRNTNFFYS